MKLWLVWFCLLWICSCYCAHLDPSSYYMSYEEILNREEDALYGIFSEESTVSSPYPTTEDEDSFAYEDSFTTTVSLDKNIVENANRTETSEAKEWSSEMPIVEEDWYTDEVQARLKIDYTPYSALLYQEDEFGLEFLCPGYWLKKDMLLIRGDCWPKDVDLNIEDTVAEVFSKNDLNLMVLRMHPNLSDSEEQHEPHLAHISDNFPASINGCTLYVLREYYELFEMHSWAIRPLPFKRARALCRENHICLRTRASAADGLDYALLCDQSLVGMLTTDRTKYERIFGKLTLLDLSVAKPWIDQLLAETLEENETQKQHGTTFRPFSLTPMPPGEMHTEEGDVI